VDAAYSGICAIPGSDRGALYVQCINTSGRRSDRSRGKECLPSDSKRLEVIEARLEIHLQLYSILREKLPSDAKGRAVLQLDDDATLADLLEHLDIDRKVIIGVNGVHIPDKSHRLSDGDEVKIFSSISGG
jgi:sulfur carrier protein ThiS